LQQDLIGERYLAEQIKLIEQQQKDNSVLKKWSHLLYEGEKCEVDGKIGLTTVVESVKTSQVNMNNPNNMSAAETQEIIIDNILEMVRANESFQEKLEDEDYNAKVEAELQRAIEAARKKSVQLLKEKSSNHIEETVREFRDASSYRRSEVGFTGNYLRRSNSNQYAQQPAEYLPQLSSSNLNSVSLEAYNSPQFKLMLDQMMKPMEIPVEETILPGEWPSAEKIGNY